MSWTKRYIGIDHEQSKGSGFTEIIVDECDGTKFQEIAHFVGQDAKINATNFIKIKKERK